MTLPDILAKAADRTDLSEQEAFEAFEAIMRGDAPESVVAALLVALRMKGETVDEITGAARAMRAHARFIDTGAADVLDIVGTGGDGANTFNISTTSCFVVAGAGVPVAKHGNRAVTSKSGAADVLQALGVNIAADPAVVEACVQENGIGFLFAQTLHPAMRFAAPVRKTLRLRTVFNLLGPLTNPAGARRQVIGVYAPELTEPFAAVLRKLGSTRALVVHGTDGLDEISCGAPTRVSELRDGAIKTYELFPEMFLDETYPLDDVRGGTPEENAAITRAVLDGSDRGAHRAIVLLNAAAGILAADRAADLREALRVAAESIDSGRALKKLRTLIEATK